MGKTGSSALQVAFVRNRDRLGQIGVDYPTHQSDRVAGAGGVTSGNAQFLLPLLASEVVENPLSLPEAAAALKDFCDEVAAQPSPLCLYSSEQLYWFQSPTSMPLRRPLRLPE